ncbi:hypothetical protein HPP92_017437 [Vanilla planifolia]|uniref:Transcription factor MYBS1 n=1 Tax=Vanilla planifolia TaxID=51239 RepID=A0A835Q9A4_VANPL|nr:hypothetical protein HPP92_017437 [Vanilla planifolia]
MMTNSWTEVASLVPPYYCSSDWIIGNNKSSENWSQQENKLFENALAHFDEHTPNRWEKVAAMIPGKTVDDVKNHYEVLKEDVSCIEAGLIPFPGYSSSSFTLDWESDDDGLKQAAYVAGSKRSCATKLSEHERKKGVPWSEEEHKRFLMGLMKYGKGDWRNISRNFVFSRTPTQVASHAQKYFIRLNSGGKDKRRASIHDITTVSLEDKRSPSPSQPSGVTIQSSSASASCTSEQFSLAVNSEQHSEAASVFNPLAIVNQFIPSQYGILQNSHHGKLDSPFRQNGVQTIQSLPSLEIRK